MSLKQMSPWRWGGLRGWKEEDRPFESFFERMNSLHKEMDLLFKGFWDNADLPSMTGPNWEFAKLNPLLDETEDEKAYHVKIELPGMDKEDVDISLSDGMLIIRGEKKQEEDEKGKDYYRSERMFGAFRRALPIPVEVDDSKIEASFDKGVLNIELPKSAEAQKKIKHIDIKAA